MAQAKEKVCVILGAGASHDVRNEGTNLINEDFKPPVARDLFNIAKHSKYAEFLDPYPGAKLLANPLASKIESGEQSIEDALREYAYHAHPQARAHFKHIPAYLRDLISRCASGVNGYVEMPSCYIHLVERLLVNTDNDVLFLVLNYDTLLESAITGWFPEYKFNQMKDYVDESRPIKVVKLHGSTNWFRRLSQISTIAGPWATVVESVDFNDLANVPESSIFIDDGVTRTFSAGGDDSRVYPVITAPLARKQLDGAVCPDSHIEIAREFIKHCGKFLIIGTSGLDGDLMELLKGGLGPGRALLLNLVDMGTSADQSLTNFKQGTGSFRTIIGLGDRYVFKEGFKTYVSGREIQQFASLKA